jgi:hypothetical protein
VTVAGVPAVYATKLLYTPNYVDVHEANSPHRHISFTYFALAHSDAFALSDEHTAIKWFSQQDLADPQYSLSPSVLFYAGKALEKARQ